MKIALVHDYLNQYGGAERVFEFFLKIFPKADIFSILYNPKKIPQNFQNEIKKRKTCFSFINNIPFAKNRHDLFSFFMPFAVENWRFHGYDLIISSSASYAKGLITPPQAFHISYMHSPTRYLWINPDEYVNSSKYSFFIKLIYRPFFKSLRKWDFLASKRPDLIIANSHFTQRKILKYYRENSSVIYPPCNIQKFLDIKRKPGNYYIVVSRLIQYKKIDLVIKTFNKLKKPLKIIGDGPLYKTLKRLALSNIEFFGYTSETKKMQIMSRAKGFIFPQEEDFGMSLVEAISAGIPAIAYKSGGALEIIQDSINGLFFNEQKEQSLISAIKNFEKMTFDDIILKNSVKKFDEKIFLKSFKNLLREKGLNLIK